MKFTLTLLTLCCLAQVALADYIPSLGRFCQRDHIEENGGSNVYAFVGNNSLNFNDILGLKFKDNEIQIISLEQRTGTMLKLDWLGSTNSREVPSLGGEDEYTNLPLMAEKWKNGRPRGSRCYCVRLNGAELDLSVESFVVRYDDITDKITKNFHKEIIAHEQRRIDSMKLGYDAFIDPANKILKEVICCDSSYDRAKKNLETYAKNVRKRATDAHMNYVSLVAARITLENNYLDRDDGLLSGFQMIFTPQSPTIGKVGAFGRVPDRLPEVNLGVNKHPNTFLDNITLKCSKDPKKFKPKPKN